MISRVPFSFLLRWKKKIGIMSKRPFEPGKEPIPAPGEFPEIEPSKEPLTDPKPRREPEIIPWDPEEDPDRVEPPEEVPPPEPAPAH